MISLKSEVESLQKDYHQYKVNPNYWKLKIEESQKKRDQLRDQYHSIEEKLQSIDKEFSENKEIEEKKFQEKMKEVKGSIEEIKEKKVERIHEIRNQKRQLDDDHSVSTGFFSLLQLVLIFFVVSLP
jgi:chromosome segregation ATPase